MCERQVTERPVKSPLASAPTPLTHAIPRTLPRKLPRTSTGARILSQGSGLKSVLIRGALPASGKICSDFL
jgi:hypothetical protein